MTLSDFYTLTTDQLESLDKQQLKKLVSEQGKKLNKRISNIKGNPKANKTAVRIVESSGGRFGVKGKDTKRSLIAEAKREQRFMDKKTSTVKGAVQVHEESGQKVTGMTSKQYAKSKASDFKKQKTSEKKAKSKTGKLTKAQKKSIDKQVKQIEKKAEKQYNDDIGEAWEAFHKAKEENPAYTGSYSKERVKQLVNDYAIHKSDNIFGRSDFKDMKDAFNYTIFSVQHMEPYYNSDDVWQTVDPESPLFGSGETPDQFRQV